MAFRQTPLAVVICSTAVMVLGILPPFLVGATTVQMRQDFAIDDRGLGLAVGVFFLAMSVNSIAAGHFAERVGPRVALISCALVSSTSLIISAVLTPSFPVLLIWVLVGGVACGFAVPSASFALIRGAPGRAGLMLGVNQAAPPAASMLAGVTVPAISIRFGWRWTYVMGAMVVLVVIATLPDRRVFARSAPTDADSTPPVHDPAAVAKYRRTMLVLSIGMALGSGAALSMGAFFVSSAVDNGMSEAAAGLSLAVGSIVSIGSRIIAGLMADRMESGQLTGVAIMLLGGAVGYLALAAMQTGPWITAAAVVGYGFGYGWSGLLFYAVSMINPTSPARAIGVVNTGNTFGAAITPPLFGVIAATSSMSAAWVMAAVASAVGGLIVLIAVQLDRSVVETEELAIGR
jgi:MFS family permease